MEKKCDMTERGRPVDEPSSTVLNFLKPVNNVLWGAGKRALALRLSNLDSTNAQIRAFVASSERSWWNVLTRRAQNGKYGRRLKYVVEMKESDRE